MNYNIDLSCTKCKKWYKLSNGYVCGDAFYENTLLAEKDWKVKTEKFQNIDEAAEFVKKLNGVFAIVLILERKLFIAVDRLRTIPLFYSVENEQVHITNHVSFETIREHGIDKEKLLELESSLFISGANTCAKGIYQVMAGEYIVFEPSGVYTKQYYYDYHFVQKSYPDKEELLRKTDEVFTNVAKRLITVLNGRRAVIPLSGGHDSRLIAYYLKKLGYDNIIAYTYGKKDNFEAVTSEKVARFLEIEWHNVEYVPKKLQKFMDEEFLNAADFYTNGTSSFCIQEFYVLHELKQKGIIKVNDVIVPGHSFDAIAGSFILPHYIGNSEITKEQLKKDIIWKQYSEGKPHNRMVDRYIDDFLAAEPMKMTPTYAFELYQLFNIRERQAKFTCNQVRLDEYFGFDWYIPLWDNELIAYWESIPLELKYQRKFFFEFTEWKYGDLMKAAPVENIKKKSEKIKKEFMLYRIVRKINQLWNYTDFHYCLSYFKRMYVYKIFLKTRILNIGYMVNYKIIELIRGGE